jgi:hypothetical protein
VHDRIEHIINKYHRNNSLRRGRVARLREVGADSGPYGKAARHADERNKILRAAVEDLRQERTRDTSHEVPAGQAEVDLVLRPLVRDVDCRQDLREVIRHEPVARPLREEADAGGDERALPVTRRLEELDPLALRVLDLVAHLRLDLDELRVDERVLVVALGVVLDEDLEGFFAAVLGDCSMQLGLCSIDTTDRKGERTEPSGRLWDEPDEDQLQ